MPEKFLKQLLLAALGLGFVAVAGAWTRPAQTPPAGNTAAPLNVSPTAQSKSGVLGVGGLGVFGRASISSAAGYSLPGNVQLGVNGAVAAAAYCDAQGQNCTTSVGSAVIPGTEPAGPTASESDFGGSWRSSPYGGCAEANWRTGSCSCPAGYASVNIYSYSWYPEGWSSVQVLCLR
jgi:hypothetical protein